MRKKITLHIELDVTGLNFLGLLIQTSTSRWLSSAEFFSQHSRDFKMLSVLDFSHDSVGNYFPVSSSSPGVRSSNTPQKGLHSLWSSCAISHILSQACLCHYNIISFKWLSLNLGLDSWEYLLQALNYIFKHCHR